MPATGLKNLLHPLWRYLPCVDVDADLGCFAEQIRILNVSALCGM